VVISPRRWRREFVGVRMGFRPGVPHASSVDASAAAKFGYNPALDGLRAIAIFVVLAGHMGAVRASNVAVDVFFVLSGFLITALMLAERARTGTVSIGRFIVRRIYRLMPAMWFYLLVGLAVTLVFKRHDYGYRKDYAGSALSSFFDVNNWFRVVHPDAGGQWLAHVWSLSAEEQFYLLWPLLFVGMLRSTGLRPYLAAAAGLLIVSSALWGCLLAGGGAGRPRVYFGLDSHAAPLLVGCLLAIWRDHALRTSAGPAPPGTRRRRRHAVTTGKVGAATAAAAVRWTAGQRLASLGLPAGIALALLAYFGPTDETTAPNWLDRAGYLPSAVLAAVVILGCDLRRDAGWVRALARRPVAWTGRIAYSIFLWHYPVISVAVRLVPRIGRWPAVVIAAVVSTVVAYLCSRFVERPAQRRRPAWADAPQGPKGAEDTSLAGYPSLGGRAALAGHAAPAWSHPPHRPVARQQQPARRDWAAWEGSAEDPEATMRLRRGRFRRPARVPGFAFRFHPAGPADRAPSKL
jgi:peptidoglycan/LPS O-acetylase OafA/YrhL